MPLDLFLKVSAVSEEVARAMAAGGLAHSAQISPLVLLASLAQAAARTKPAGLVHICASREDGDVLHERCMFDGDRSAVAERPC